MKTLTGDVPLVVGQQSYNIVFSPAFAAIPTSFSAQVQMASSGSEIFFVNADVSTLTASGVTVWLSGIPTAASTGSVINWRSEYASFAEQTGEVSGATGMTIAQLVHRIGRRAKKGGDFTKLSLTEQMDVLEAANSALQQVYNILPIYFKEMTVGLTLPKAVSLSGVVVTNGSNSVGGVIFGADAIGRTIILDGDSNINQVLDATTLMSTYNGPSGTVSGTLYGDAIYSSRLPFDRIIGNPDFADSTSWPMLPRSMMRNDFPFLGMIPSVGRPQFWWVQPLGNSQGMKPLLVLRFWPMPDQVYPIRVRMGFWPLRLTLADLDLAVTIPVPDQFLDAALVPIGLRSFMTSPTWEMRGDEKFVLDAAARGDAFLANQPGQVGSPSNRCFTPVGY